MITDAPRAGPGLSRLAAMDMQLSRHDSRTRRKWADSGRWGQMVGLDRGQGAVLEGCVLSSGILGEDQTGRGHLGFTLGHPESSQLATWSGHVARCKVASQRN